MEWDPPCPACSLRGTIIGYDDQHREVFACRTPGCEVAEYDREVIRRRRGLPAEPPIPARPPCRRTPR